MDEDVIVFTSPRIRPMDSAVVVVLNTLLDGFERLCTALEIY